MVRDEVRVQRAGEVRLEIGHRYKVDAHHPRGGHRRLGLSIEIAMQCASDSVWVLGHQLTHVGFEGLAASAVEIGIKPDVDDVSDGGVVGGGIGGHGHIVALE